MSTTVQLRPVQTTPGDRYTVAAIVVQESPDGTGREEIAALAAQLADEARRLLAQERPGVQVTAAVALSGPAPVVVDEPGEAADVEVNRHAYQASVAGRAVGLSFREFELLAFLVDHPGQVFSRRQLVSTVWEGAAVGDRTVDVHVRRLRVKLGPAADRITTIRNVGYRFEPANGTPAELETVA